MTVPPPVPAPPVVPAPPPLPAAGTASPWLSIWIAPRATLRVILLSGGRRGILPIAMLAGVWQAFGLAATKPIGETLPPGGLLASVLLLGPLLGLAWLYGLGLLLRVTGRWLGGRGDGPAMRAALAWSAVPLVWSLPLWLPRAALLGGEMFHSAPPGIEGHALSGGVFALLLLLEATMKIWSIVLAAKCVGEAHGFSAWRAVGAYLLAVLMVMAPLAILAVAAIALGLRGS